MFDTNRSVFDRKPLGSAVSRYAKISIPMIPLQNWTLLTTVYHSISRGNSGRGMVKARSNLCGCESTELKVLTHQRDLTRERERPLFLLYPWLWRRCGENSVLIWFELYLRILRISWYTRCPQLSLSALLVVMSIESVASGMRLKFTWIFHNSLCQKIHLHGCQ